jgi:hypothetical protein
MSVVHGMMAAGWDQLRIGEYFHTRPNGLAVSLRQHYLGRLSAEIDQAIAAGVVRRKAHQESCGVARRVIADEWLGAHPSAFRTLWGLYGIAEIAGGFAFTASRRQVAEAAGLGGITHNDASYTAAAKAVAWLEQRTLIGFVPGNHSPGALNASSTYCLHAPTELAAALRERELQTTRTPIPFATSPIGLVAPADCADASSVVAEKSRGTESLQAIPLVSSWSSPLWEPAGLGPTACRVWHLLAETDESSVKLIAGRLGITRQATRNVLRKLAGHGLVRAEEAAYVAVSADIDALAELLGLADRPRRRAAGNQCHRFSRERHLLRDRSSERRNFGEKSAEHQRASDGTAIDYRTGEILLRSTIEAATVLLGCALASLAVAA